MLENSHYGILYFTSGTIVTDQRIRIRSILVGISICMYLGPNLPLPTVESKSKDERGEMAGREKRATQ